MMLTGLMVVVLLLGSMLACCCLLPHSVVQLLPQLQKQLSAALPFTLHKLHVL